VHSALDGDEGVVYDNQRGDSTHDDTFIQVWRLGGRLPTFCFCAAKASLKSGLVSRCPYLKHAPFFLSLELYTFKRVVLPPPLVGGARLGALEQRALFAARLLGPGLAPAPAVRRPRRVGPQRSALHTHHQTLYLFLSVTAFSVFAELGANMACALLD
jgi:hypothetical protein